MKKAIIQHKTITELAENEFSAFQQLATSREKEDFLTDMIGHTSAWLLHYLFQGDHRERIAELQPIIEAQGLAEFSAATIRFAQKANPEQKTKALVLVHFLQLTNDTLPAYVHPFIIELSEELDYRLYHKRE
jgi:hypothetical protein